MKKPVLLFVAIILSEFGPALATETCSTVKTCLDLRTKTEARIEFLSKAKNLAPTLDRVVKNADGSVRLMNQYEAIAYCQEQGLRLPTAREFAAYIQKNNESIKVRETSADDFYPITEQDQNRQSDKFYFNRGNFTNKSLNNQGLILRFWTSSMQKVSPHSAAMDMGYLFDFSKGDFMLILSGSHYYDSAVRCVLSK